MTDEDEKLLKVTFRKEANAKEILAGIRQTQDNWAKKFPEHAHRLYPKVYHEQGNRIPKQPVATP